MLKKILSSAMIGGFLFFNTLSLNVSAKEVNPLKNITNYNVYYGWEYDDSIVEKLKKYDMIVVEPMEIKDNILEDIRKSGTKVYAYMSLTEISPYDNDLVATITDDDYLRINGEILENYGCKVGDIRKKTYRDKVIDVIDKRIVNGKYDGLFIDTLDTVEYESIIGSQSLVDELTSASVQFVKEIAEKHPSLSIIQNRAFIALEKGTSNYIDAIVYENMTNKTGSYYDKINSRISNFTSNGGVCLALVNDPIYKDSCYEISMERGWKYYYRPDEQYTEFYEYLNPTTDTTGHINALFEQPNTLSVEMSSNTIDFGSTVSGLENVELEDSLTITVKSSLPYSIKVKSNQPFIIGTKNPINKIPLSVMELRLDNNEYNPISELHQNMLDNAPATLGKTHSVDVKLNKTMGYPSDNYNLVVNINVSQQ